MHIVDTGVDLAFWVVRQHRVNHSLVKGKFSSVIGHFQHIIDLRLNKPCPYLFCPLSKRSYHFYLYLTWLGLDIVIVDLWHREF